MLMWKEMETGASGGGGITKEEFTINTVANVDTDTGITTDGTAVALFVCDAATGYRVCCEIENGTKTDWYNQGYIITSILPNGNLAIKPTSASISGTYSVTVYK